MTADLDMNTPCDHKYYYNICVKCRHHQDDERGLDLSPEAVERLAKRHALHVSSKYPTAATLRALSAELAAARAENELMAKAIDEREIASGLSTNGGFWRWWAAQARDTAAKLTAATKASQLPSLDALLSVATDDEADAIRACAARVSNR